MLGQLLIDVPLLLLLKLGVAAFFEAYLNQILSIQF